MFSTKASLETPRHHKAAASRLLERWSLASASSGRIEAVVWTVAWWAWSAATLWWSRLEIAWWALKSSVATEKVLAALLILWLTLTLHLLNLVLV